MKVYGTFMVKIDEVIDTDSESEKKKYQTEQVKVEIEGSAEAILTIINELREKSNTLFNFHLE